MIGTTWQHVRKELKIIIVDEVNEKSVKFVKWRTWENRHDQRKTRMMSLAQLKHDWRKDDKNDK